MNNINLALFKSCLQKDQRQLRWMCYYKLRNSGLFHTIVSNEDFVYAKGQIPVLLVAHLDTVHLQLSSESIYHDEKRQTMWSPCGIGGDDRCGVYSILSLINDKFAPHVLFTTDEEIGASGALRAAYGLKVPKVKFIVELDRRGEKDAVFYDCANEDFQKYILRHGFEKKFGSFSDICMLSPEWNIASVNLSCGYFEEHTKHEYINLNYMEKTISKVKNILVDSQSQSVPYYDFQEDPYTLVAWEKSLRENK